MKTLIDKLITWLCARSAKKSNAQGFDIDYIRIISKTGELSIKRFCPLWYDSAWSKNKFNIFLHCWVPPVLETDPYAQMHDHPRWSISIVLKGEGYEFTPWKKIHLKPGKIIFRGRKSIHQLQPKPGTKMWTLFIVGPWRHKQNFYKVEPMNVPKPGAEE